jgi:tRNA (guanine37-N1)-methyltransferase
VNNYKFPDTYHLAVSLKEDLAEIIPPDKLHLSGYCGVIGDAAVVSLGPELEIYKRDAARAIIAKHKDIGIVLNKTSKADGDRRVPQYEVLEGEDTIVTCKEFGFSYRFDISKVFFNPHLKYERHRVAGMAVPGEKVLVPFAGAGPFAIALAAKGCRVVAVEKSCDACQWMALNASINGAASRIDILNADALSLPGIFRTDFDRLVIPAPYGMDDALDVLAPLTRTGGAIHFYTFKKKYQIKGLAEKYSAMGFSVEHVRRCGNVAPGVSRWAFDLNKG